MPSPPFGIPLQPAWDDTNAAGRLIPGAYERNTLTLRQPGSFAPPYGTDGLPSDFSTMSATTILERQKEGGGGVSQRS